MINSTKQSLSLPIPLTLRRHHTAQLFYQLHSDPEKAKQVYLNTLAVNAVHSYLGWLGIATDLEASDSWNPTIQTLADVADLEILYQGKLECRPVLPGATVCHIPSEAWSDRIGYIAVRLDADLQTANLLGFVPNVAVEELPLSQLQPIATLFDHLKLRAQPETLEESVNLGQWIQGMVTSGWHTVEELFGPQPVLSFRNLDLSSHSETSSLTTRGKLLELVAQPDIYQIALIVGVMPVDLPQVDIWVKLRPATGVPYLPEDLEIKVLDDQGIAVMQAQSRRTDMLQLKFRGASGEQFFIEITLNDDSLIETFVI